MYHFSELFLFRHLTEYNCMENKIHTIVMRIVILPRAISLIQFGLYWSTRIMTYCQLIDNSCTRANIMKLLIVHAACLCSNTMPNV